MKRQQLPLPRPGVPWPARSSQARLELSHSTGVRTQQRPESSGSTASIIGLFIGKRRPPCVPHTPVAAQVSCAIPLTPLSRTRPHSKHCEAPHRKAAAPRPERPRPAQRPSCSQALWGFSSGAYLALHLVLVLHGREKKLEALVLSSLLTTMGSTPDAPPPVHLAR